MGKFTKMLMAGGGALLLLAAAAPGLAGQVPEPEMGGGFFGCPADTQLQLAFDPRPPTIIPANVAVTDPRYVVRCVRRRVETPLACPAGQSVVAVPGVDRCAAATGGGTQVNLSDGSVRSTNTGVRSSRDGTSNTVAVGESDGSVRSGVTTARDGTSNTIVAGEAPSLCGAGLTLLVDVIGTADRCGRLATPTPNLPIAGTHKVLARITAAPTTAPQTPQ